MGSGNKREKYTTAIDTIFTYIERYPRLNLLAVFLIALSLRLALSPYSLPIEKDTYLYLIKSLEITRGDFAPLPNHTIGWPIILSLFFYFYKSASIFQNMVFARVISDIFGALSIFPLAYLGNRLFNKRYSFILLLLFCFCSPLIISAGSVYPESLFIFLMLISLGFVYRATEKPGFLLLAAISSAAAYYVRPNGFLVLIMILISVYLMRNQIPQFKYRYLLYVLLVYFVIAAPLLYQRYYYFGSPFSYGENNKVFVDSYDLVWSYNIPAPSFIEYLKTHTFIDYFRKFVIFGIGKLIFRFIYNLISPLLLIFFGYGVWRSIKTPRVIPITIGLLVWAIAYIPVIDIHNSPRQLYPEIPFILIFSTIGIYEIISTYKFQRYFLALFIGIYMLVSLIGPINNLVKAKSDPLHDGLVWGKWIASHVQGKIAIIRDGDLIMMNLPDTRVSRLHNSSLEAPVSNLSVIPPGYFTDLNSGMKWLKEIGVTHIVIDQQLINRRPFLKQIYTQPELPPYLTEIYSNYHTDSEWKIRVYAIDWSKFQP